MPRPKLPIINLDTRDWFPSQREAAERVGVSYAALNSHLRGRTRRCAGYRFQYEYILQELAAKGDREAWLFYHGPR